MITANGAGTIVPAAQVDIGFRTNGVVVDVNAMLGQPVGEGDVLAQLDDSTAQRNLESAQRAYLELNSQASIIATRQEVAEAEDALNTTRSTLGWLVSPSVVTWEERTADAEVALQKAKAENATAEEIEKLEQDLKYAQANLTYAHNAYYDYLRTDST